MALKPQYIFIINKLTHSLGLNMDFPFNTSEMLVPPELSELSLVHEVQWNLS